MKSPSKTTAAIVAVTVICVGWTAGSFGFAVGRRYEINSRCCLIPSNQNLVLSVKEALHLVSYPSQIGQDKWVSEAVFPGVTAGFFLDVGSADGVVLSNTVALERKGWAGICIDPFPRNMDGRTCKMLKKAVSSESGKRVTFYPAGDLGGIADYLDTHKTAAEQSRPIELTTVSLGEILEREHAPRFIHFMSLDIEGAEFEALRSVPFDKYKFGALAIEHNYEEPKRRNIQVLLEGHGYKRSHTWYQDDFYVPAEWTPTQ